MAWLTKITLLFPLLLILSGCSPDKKEEQLAGNLYGFNHVKDTSVNWFSVNGYYGQGAAGTCCIMIPSKWSPGKSVLVEWEVDPNPFPSDSPGVTDPKFEDYMKKHEANYRHYSKRVEIPQYDDPCGLQVHFLPCQEVKITLSCYSTRHPNYPIKEPNDMEEPAECPAPPHS
ncbi:DUF3304 domain-containing protein [Providencia alcalifaciens]